MKKRQVTASPGQEVIPMDAPGDVQSGHDGAGGHGLPAQRGAPVRGVPCPGLLRGLSGRRTARTLPVTARRKSPGGWRSAAVFLLFHEGKRGPAPPAGPRDCWRGCGSTPTSSPRPRTRWPRWGLTGKLAFARDRDATSLPTWSGG